MKNKSKFHLAAGQRGFTLIELMIALVLGLIVVAAAGGLFLSNQRTYAATEAMGRIGESSRVSFELMARDIREAGGIPCGRSLPVANVLNSPTVGGIYDWGTGVIGYDGATAPAWATGAPPQVAGSDALDMHSGSDTGVSVVSHNPPSAEFKVSQGGVVHDGDIAMVCDYTVASIFQVTNANDANATVVHNDGNGGSTKIPGNCTKALGYPVDCSVQCTGSGKSATDPHCHTYGKNSMLVRMKAIRWYLGSNTRGQSLYRISLDGTGSPQVNEIADRVKDLQFTYLLTGATSYVPATSGLDWSKVTAVHVDITLEAIDKQASGNTPIDRNVAFNVNLRNRVD